MLNPVCPGQRRDDHRPATQAVHRVLTAVLLQTFSRLVESAIMQSLPVIAFLSLICIIASQHIPHLSISAFREFAGNHDRKFTLFDESYYLSHYSSHVPKNMTAYEHWVKVGSLNGFRSHGGLPVLKIVMMTKDEWPLLKSWVLYHGRIFGFHNLHIIDGSTDSRCLKFLEIAGRIYGVHVIYSQANLNKLGAEILRLMNELAFSSDYLVKMDTDEFIVRQNTTNGAILVDGILESMNQLPQDGALFHLQWNMVLVTNRTNCENPKLKHLDIIHKSNAFHVSKGMQKAFTPAMSYVTTDLGGHTAKIFREYADYILSRNDSSIRMDKLGSPIRDSGDLGIVHAHFSCVEDVVANNRKALSSHGFIDPNSSVATQIETLDKLGNGKWKTGCGVTSCHKVRDYYNYLIHPDKYVDLYYSSSNRSIASPETLYSNTLVTFIDEGFKIYSDLNM